LKVLSHWVTNIVIVVDAPHVNLANEFPFTKIIK